MKKILCLPLVCCLLSGLFSENFIIPIEQNGKIGFINDKMKLISYPEYDNIFLQQDSYVWAVKKDKRNLITESTLIFADGSKKSLSLIKENVRSIGKKYYAIVSDTGSSRLSKIYDVITKKVVLITDYEVKDSETEKYILVENPYDKTKSRNFFIDIKGNEILPNNSYLHIISYDSDSKTAFFESKDNEVLLIDFDGNILIKDNLTVLDVGSMGDGLFIGYLFNKKGYFNKKGELEISVNIFNEQKLNLLPVFNSDVIPCTIEDGKIYLQENVVEKKSNNWAIINSKNQIIKSNISADYLYPFSDDGVAVGFNTDDGLNYFLIDKKGKMITNQKFDFIADSINGYSRAKKNNIDYLISVKDGKVYRVFEILIQNRND